MNTQIANVLLSPRFQVSVTIQHAESGVYVDGEYIRGDEPTTETIKAVVHPLNALALPTTFAFQQAHVLPEGVRTEQAIVLYTRTRLAVNTDQTPADRIVGYHGSDWEVLSSARYDDYGFWVSIASELKKDLT